MTGPKVVGCVLVAAACAAAAIWLVNDVRPAQAAPSTTRVADPVRPVWSVRRLPSAVTAVVETTLRNRASLVLTNQLAPVVAPVDSCVGVDGPTGALVRIDTSATLAPASTLKLITGTVAIRRLGAGHRFVTRVVADGKGNLVLVGGGDPLLATPSFIAAEHGEAEDRNTPLTPLANLADAIAATGIRHVPGALLVDDHLQDSLRFLPGWKPSYAQEGQIGALGALTVNRGFEPGMLASSADPALDAGRQLELLLGPRGVTFGGGVRHGLAPARAHEVAHIDSQPLSTIVEEMLTISDNYVAEQLLRAIAVDAGVVPGTSAAGVAVVRRDMRAFGVPVAGLVMYDGSGLAPGDRVSCVTMLAVIDGVTRDHLDAVDRGLAVWDRTGTLATRTGADSVIGRLRAKTGSIDGVVGLVGIVDGPDHLHFAFLANGDFSAGAGAALQASVANAMAASPQLRAPSGLVPAP